MAKYKGNVKIGYTTKEQEEQTKAIVREDILAPRTTLDRMVAEEAVWEESARKREARKE